VSPADDSSKPRPVGEAAWKAQRDALDQRNAAAKKTAKEHVSATTRALLERERRLARAEEEQLRELNDRIARK